MRKPNARKAGVPTQPRPTDENGFELDEWGLPLVGPRRMRVLKDMGRRDPRDFPEDWPENRPGDRSEAQATAAPEAAKSKAASVQTTEPVKENSNG